MQKVQYGKTTIEFKHQVDPTLKNAYITVDFYEGVILKSPEVTKADAKKLVLKKARWIIEKLKLVAQIPAGDVVTGSRILYLGKRYYTRVIASKTVKRAEVKFGYSRFTVYVNPELKLEQVAIKSAFEDFYRKKAFDKITKRVKQWQETTGLKPKAIRFRKLNKRWGSCTKLNEVIINIDAVKLPFSLIDYIVVHELCHILHKDHSPSFWQQVSKYLPDYQELDDKIVGMKL